MIKLRKLSFKNKLILLILLVTFVSMFAGLLLNILTSIHNLKSDMIRETRLYADFLGESFISPLLFNDKSGGKEILSKITTIPWVDGVEIYNSNGTLFTEYKKSKFVIPVEVKMSVNLTRFIDNRLYVSKQIDYMQERVGRIIVVASTSELKKKINHQILSMITIILLVLFISYYLSLRFQKIISVPILSLAEVMKSLSKTGDYSIRVEKKSDDEIGVLYDGFNEMLAQIQKKQKENEEANKKIVIGRKHLAEAQRIASLGSWEWDVENRTMVFSDEMFRLLGLEPDSLPTLNVLLKGMYKRDRLRFLDALKKAKSSGKSFRIKSVRKSANGKKYLLLRGEVIKSENSNIIIHGTAQDVTEQTEAEIQIKKLNQELEKRVETRTAELKAVNEELEQFAYVVSHDLKAPLRGVSQLSQWLLEDYHDKLDHEGREHIELMKERIYRMYNLIDGILEYSRVGRLRERKQEVDLNILIDQIIESLSPPPRIEVVLENKMPVIYAEKTRIQQVFQNLIGNAIKFNDKPDGVVTIYSFEDENYFKFSVSDNGPGIDRKYHKKIFQIFQTLTPRDENESTGIGLTLVKKIIETLGGEIWLESEPGLGSTFYFTFNKKIVSINENE